MSCTKGTWFENTKIPPAQILLVTICFAHKFSYSQTAVACTIGNHLVSENTIADWFSYCREVCVLSMEHKYANRGKIGGPNHIVQVDECKIGRRKYHRGRVVEGNWILGMIDINTNEVRMAICPNNRRDAQTLYDLISEHVELTSTHGCMEGLQWLVSRWFCKSFSRKPLLHFVDPITHVHTNNIESHWRSLRHRLSRGGIRKDQLDSHISEHLWHLDCKNRGADPFQDLMEDIKAVYPVH